MKLYMYYVVQFLEKPYSTADSVVCVPFKWITLAKKTNDIVSVAYPAEYSPYTRNMVENLCTQGSEWRCYKVKAICGKKSFRAAERYIKSWNNTESEKTDSLNTENNESKLASNRNTRNATKKYHKQYPILRNNRSNPIKLSIKRPMPNISIKDLFQKRMKTAKTSELISETPNRSNESGKSLNENKLVPLDLDYLNQEQHDTTDVKMSIDVSNTDERTVLESNADYKSSLIPVSQHCQPVMDTYEEHLPTVVIHGPNEMQNNDKLNTIDERPDCQNSSTSGAAEHSTKSERNLSMPLKIAQKDPRFWNYTHPTIKQMQLAQTSNKMYGKDLCTWPLINTINTPAQTSYNQSHCLSHKSQHHQSPSRNADSLHHNLQLQNQPGSRPCKVKIIEDKIIVASCSNAANPSPEDTSYNNQLLQVNGPVFYYDQHERRKSIERSMNTYENTKQMCPDIATMTSPSALYRLREMISERSMNTYENTQQMCPDIATMTSPSALYRLREMISEDPDLPNHPHNEQLLTIEGVDIYQEPCTQEILDSSSEMNYIDQSAHTPIAMHQEPCTQEIFDRSTGANPIDQSLYPQSETHQEPCTQEILYTPSKMKPINEHACSPSALHQEARTQTSTEVNPIEQSDSSQSPNKKAPKTSDRNRHIPTKVIPISWNHRSSMENAPLNEIIRFRVRKPCKFPKLLYAEGCSPVQENDSHEKVSLHVHKRLSRTQTSTEVNPIEQSDSSQSPNKKAPKTSDRNRQIPTKVIPISFPVENAPLNEIIRFRVRKPRKFPKLLYAEGCSPVQENDSHEKVSLQNKNLEKSIKMDDDDQNSQHLEIRESSPAAVQHSSRSSNQGSSLWNGSSEKQISLFTQDQFISKPRHQKRFSGKPSKLKHIEKSTYLKNNTDNETSSVQSTPNTNKPIRRSCAKNLSPVYEHCMQEQISPISEVFSVQEVPTEEIAVEKITEDNHIETTTCPEINTEQESKVPNLSSIYSLPELKAMAEASIIKVIQKTIKGIQLSLNDGVFEDFNNTSGQLNEAIERMRKEIDRYLHINESVSEEPPVKPEEKSADKNKKSNSVEPNYVADEDGDDDDDNGDDSNDSDSDYTNENVDGLQRRRNEPPKKKRGSKRSFVLPPEYDAHDSRWTLKYQGIEPGVVELVPHSKIYISSLRLANCKRVAQDYKKLGRMLLVEIFSQNALSVCSLTGAKANAFDVHESDIRPGLDKDTRTTLLTYVENYGRKQGWGPFDTHSVVNSLRSKIQEMRSKYGSTV